MERTMPEQIIISELYGEILSDGTCHLSSDSVSIDLPPVDWQIERMEFDADQLRKQRQEEPELNK